MKLIKFQLVIFQYGNLSLKDPRIRKMVSRAARHSPIKRSKVGVRDLLEFRLTSSASLMGDHRRNPRDYYSLQFYERSITYRNPVSSDDDRRYGEEILYLLQ